MATKINADGSMTLQGLSSDPSSPSNGQLWYNSTAARVKGHEGGSTRSLIYTHPNHSGDVTSVGDGATTAQPAMISGKSALTSVANDDYVMVYDTSSGNLVKVAIDDLRKVPSFAATSTSGRSINSGSSWLTYPYNNELFDTLGNYNNSNYIFTAPSAGKYLFTWHGGISGLGANYIVTLSPWLQGSTELYRASSHARSNGNMDTLTGGSAIFSMNSGQYIKIFIITNDPNTHSTTTGVQSYFSARRLSAS